MQTELRQEIRYEGEQSRHHLDVIRKALASDIQLLAEDLALVLSRLAHR